MYDWFAIKNKNYHYYKTRKLDKIMFTFVLLTKENIIQVTLRRKKIIDIWYILISLVTLKALIQTTSSLLPTIT